MIQKPKNPGKKKPPDYGLVRRGNRYYCAAIDKANASFTGGNYKEPVEILEPITDDALYTSAAIDQNFAFIQQIQAAAKPGADSLSDFDRIFFNPRVLKTLILANVCKEYCEKFRTSVAHALKYLLEGDFNPEFQKDYAVREKYRAQFAGIILEKLEPLPQHINPADIKKLIIEDLRGTCYENLFKEYGLLSPKDFENEELINAVIHDFPQEFEIMPKEKPENSLKLKSLKH